MTVVSLVTSALMRPHGYTEQIACAAAITCQSETDTTTDTTHEICSARRKHTRPRNWNTVIFFLSFFLFSFFISSMGRHTLPSHASAEACPTGWPNAQPHAGMGLV